MGAAKKVRKRVEKDACPERETCSQIARLDEISATQGGRIVMKTQEHLLRSAEPGEGI